MTPAQVAEAFNVIRDGIAKMYAEDEDTLPEPWLALVGAGLTVLESLVLDLKRVAIATEAISQNAERLVKLTEVRG